ncbi:gluconokinase [Fimicolochytrium jonesii]|uniref:gluconokinase n=1 Tax=Fimicolochytrium jonesii TaxID=1396493 RepID=UPI0022FE2F40|nr:gluconokinase [Fimicolochytrium jonesii]KAI8821390.1 gluconokinase [Fimicolochytrium jonesii]
MTTTSFAPHAHNEAIIVMGVSGSGKSTVAEGVAKRLRELKTPEGQAPLEVVCLDGDDFHTEEHKKKMASGHALTDEDRQPWLQTLVEEVDKAASKPTPDPKIILLACSSLKRQYRDLLRRCLVANGGKIDLLRFLYLDAPREELVQRLKSRQGHYFKVDGLDSQLETLEKPDPKEETDAIWVEHVAEHKAEDVVQKSLAALGFPASA